MLQENTRCAWHTEEEGIGSESITCDRVLCSIGTSLGVMILYKGNGIAAVISVRHNTGSTKFCPVVIIDGIANSIPEGEVKGCTLNGVVYFGAVDPCLHGRGIAVPVFTYRKLRCCSLIIFTKIGGGETFSDIVTESV